MSTSFDPLQQYVNYMLSISFLQLRPPPHAINVGEAGISYNDKLLGVVIDRQGQFQTELFIVPPHIKKLATHTHPDVSSIELSLAGDFQFECDGVVTEYKSTGQPVSEISFPVVVKNTSWHGAPVINEGAAFLSFQYWLNGKEPSSVGYNFQEEPVNN